jgi:hypothetical protein
MELEERRAEAQLFKNKQGTWELAVEYNLNHLSKATLIVKRKPSSKLLNSAEEVRSQHPVVLSRTMAAEPFGTHRKMIQPASRRSLEHAKILQEGQLVTSLSQMNHTNKNYHIQSVRAFHHTSLTKKYKVMPSHNSSLPTCWSQRKNSLRANARSYTTSSKTKKQNRFVIFAAALILPWLAHSKKKEVSLCISTKSALRWTPTHTTKCLWRSGSTSIQC